MQGAINGEIREEEKAVQTSETALESEKRDNDTEQLIGTYVGRDSSDGNGRVLLGKVVSYDSTSKFFSIFYENGKRESLGYQQVGKILLMDHKKLSHRKRKLDHLAAVGEIRRPNTRSKKNNPTNIPNEVAQVSLSRPKNKLMVNPNEVTQASLPCQKNDPTDYPNPIKVTQASFPCPKNNLADNPNEVTQAPLPFSKNNLIGNPNEVARASLPCPSASDEKEDDGDDDDSSTDLCDYDHKPVSSSSPQVQVVPLPPSSGDINIPEDSIPYLFSVYNFLRSFSLQLFLSPFGLDDFVGSLNCTVQNSLLDAIHLSLMLALRRHLQMLSSEDSKLACKCLRHCDWTLLDSLTWPAILLGYLYVMGYMKQLDEKFYSLTVSGNEYYGLPVGLKFKVLQILCDDVVDSDEIRTELGTREGMEEVDEFGFTYRDPLDSGPRRVHPRYSKTSACKSLEALENSVEPKLPIPISKVPLPYADASQDGNSDECQLCGMDGILICCDGCPSAYHSRCIGLNKQYLPDGPWYCPECTVNKVSTNSSRIGKGTSGAEIFGTDASGRMFLGTCNYLLVVGTSLNSESLVRYYNSEGVTNILNVILASENASVYADICRGISKYWEVPLINVRPGNPGHVWDPLLDKEPGLYFPPYITSSRRTSSVSNDANGVHHVNDAAEENLNGRDVVGQIDHFIEEEVNGSSLESTDKVNLSDALTEDHDLSKNRVQNTANQTLFPVRDKLCAPETATLTVEKICPNSASTNFTEQQASGSVVTEMSYLSQTKSAGRLILLENETSSSVNENITDKEEASGFNALTKKESVSVFNGSILDGHSSEKYSIIQRNSQFPVPFKPQAYTNQYIQGDIAASAAANLAVLASEGSKVSEERISSNPRRTLAADTAVQVKAFAGATLNFFWPVSDKKLIEIPRERCGWCIACKAASSWKKGCLLNLAATNATKRYARNFNVLRPVKHVDSHIPVVAAQIAHMEESLRGLIGGPLSNVQYNKQWHKLAKEASNCKALKLLLLELEKSIRGIAFCGDWTKPVDDWLIDFSSSASGMCRTGTGKKRGPGGRRPRKQSGAFEFENDSSSENMLWLRRGKLTKVLLLKGALPSSLVKKAGRQGGTRSISGIHYPEGFELPRRSHQFAWRAAVEMSKNTSQLALQVRYIDAHIRWKDLVRPEQNPLDSKGSDVDAMAFRNALICDKRITENKIKYALTFTVQKHRALRVTKNIVETEKLQNGCEKLWFFENHIPLYLIKEYEEKVALAPMSSSMMLKSHHFLRLWKRQLRDRSDTFSYLMRKGQEPSRLSCASCQQEVFFRESARCNSCQGFCHRDCTIASITVKDDDLGFLFLCNICSAKSATPISVNKEMLNMQLSLEGQNQRGSSQLKNQNQANSKCMLQNKYPKPTTGVSSSVKASASGSKSSHKVKHGGQSIAYGLIWKRKNGDDSGTDFRINNILLKGKEGTYPKANVTCSLCNKPYDSELMYIRCGNCPKWYHADAVLLEEAQIFDLVGFKCCTCRRKASPKCPYADPNNKKAEREACTPVNAKRNENILSETPKFGHLTSLPSNSKIEDFVTSDNDPLLYSFEKVEPIGEQSLLVTRSQKKLSVRRPLVKHENGANDVYATQNANPQYTEFHESIQPVEGEGGDAEEALAVEDLDLMSAQVEWDSSQACGYYGDDAPDNMDLIDQQNDGMEYEPQTYFSFTELLASDDQLDDNQCNMPVDNSVDWPSIDFENIYQDDIIPWDSSGAYDVGPSNDFGVVSIEIASEGEPCHLCKLNEPSPDLVCVVCKMHIHSHCSPWEDCDGTHWRCGGCREWK